MAKKIEDAIREADEEERNAWAPIVAKRLLFIDLAPELNNRWTAACARLHALRAAQARGETTVPDGD